MLDKKKNFLNSELSLEEKSKEKAKAINFNYNR